MNIEYRSNRLKRQLTSATETKKAFGSMAKKVIQRLSEMKASMNLAVLMQIPAAGCHQLKGSRQGEWAVNISGNFRMIFILTQGPLPKKEDHSLDTATITDIKILGTEDYH
jgi:proteic killer suppression protein